MGKLIFIFLIFTASLSSLAQNIENISDSLLIPSLSNTEIQSINGIGLFESDDILYITLTFDITELKRTKSKGEYHDAVLQVQENDVNTVNENIQIKARGNYRRNNCSFPPIQFNFKRDSTSIGEQLNKVKLVTHCMYTNKYENFVLREYLAYKIFNVLSDYSFKVRLVNISYVDTGAKKKKFQRFAFLIEPIDFLVKRYCSGT